MTDIIHAFLDTILPSDQTLGVPSGASLDITRPTSRDGIEQRLADVATLIDQTAHDLLESDFVTLSSEDRLKIIEKAKRKDMRLMTAMIVHCLRHYYTDPRVLRCLPAGAVPPFPVGNQMAEDDWSILEPVYQRGPVYREVTP